MMAGMTDDKKAPADKSKSTAQKDHDRAEQKGEEAGAKPAATSKPEWNRATHGNPPAGRESQYNVS